nr:CxxC-x17-CxxC domain-containing protein [Methanocella sp. CWC-04]
MHKATCSDCGNECQVPFRPNGSKPVYCNDCFPKHRVARKPRY